MGVAMMIKKKMKKALQTTLLLFFAFVILCNGAVLAGSSEVNYTMEDAIKNYDDSKKRFEDRTIDEELTITMVEYEMRYYDFLPLKLQEMWWAYGMPASTVEAMYMHPEDFPHFYVTCEMEKKGKGTVQGFVGLWSTFSEVAWAPFKLAIGFPHEFSVKAKEGKKAFPRFPVIIDGRGKTEEEILEVLYSLKLEFYFYTIYSKNKDWFFAKQIASFENIKEKKTEEE